MNRRTDTWWNGCFGKMNDHPVPTTSHCTTTLPTWMLFQKLVFKSTLPINGQSGIQVCPPTSSDNLYLLCVSYSMVCTYRKNLLKYERNKYSSWSDKKIRQMYSFREPTFERSCEAAAAASRFVAMYAAQRANRKIDFIFITLNIYL